MAKENCRHSIADNATDAVSDIVDEIEVSIDQIVSDAAIVQLRFQNAGFHVLNKAVFEIDIVRFVMHLSIRGTNIRFASLQV